MAPDSDDDAAALRERVRELEQTVDDQQTTIDSLQEPTPSRRGVLAALTGVAGAGALGAYSQRGAAQAAGQVGTQSAPVDVEAYDLNVQGSLTGVDTGVENPLTETLDAGGNNLTNVGALDAQEAEATNESFVRGIRSTETASQTAATRTNIVDGESKDNRNEFNVSQEFIPDKTGQYEVTGQFQMSGSTSTGDELFLAIREGGVDNVRAANYEAPDNARRFNFSFKPELTSGTAYAVKAYNNNSSFIIDTGSFVQFVWSPVQ